MGGRGANSSIKTNYSKAQRDILDQFGTDAGYPRGRSRLLNLREQIDSMRYNNRSTYDTARDLVEGGTFLIYNEDIQNYLKERKIKFNEDNFFDVYTDYMAKNIVRLYNKK